MKKLVRVMAVLFLTAGAVQAQVVGCNTTYYGGGTTYSTDFCYAAWVPGVGLRYFYKTVSTQTFRNACGNSYTVVTTTSPCSY